MFLCFAWSFSEEICNSLLHYLIEFEHERIIFEPAFLLVSCNGIISHFLFWEYDTNFRTLSRASTQHGKVHLYDTYTFRDIKEN